MIRFGQDLCGNLEAASRREWFVRAHCFALSKTQRFDSARPVAMLVVFVGVSAPQ
jgi:hypothetical protein